MLYVANYVQEHYEVESDENRVELAQSVYEQYLKRDVSRHIPFLNEAISCHMLSSKMTLIIHMNN